MELEINRGGCGGGGTGLGLHTNSPHLRKRIIETGEAVGVVDKEKAKEGM